MIDQWLQCVNQRNVEKAVSLYADDATLWGTFSETRRDGAYRIREYFTHFLGLDFLQAAVKHFTTRCRNDIKVYSGEYTFRHRQDGSDKRVNARFSFVTQILNDTELILEHHSSIIPKSQYPSSGERLAYASTLEHGFLGIYIVELLMKRAA